MMYRLAVPTATFRGLFVFVVPWTAGAVVSEPFLGGLHHSYERQTT